MPRSLLDTDTLSEIMKGRNPLALQKASQYLAQYGVLTFSLMTRYEILRGLKAKNATAQLAAFDRRCRNSDVLRIDDSIIVQAADLYADLKQRGQLISDADLIIAATALAHGLALVTTNTAHFNRIQGLTLDCWTTP
ncbi:MAG: type II toxin-antitoxin system VapC family toxin [Armatimonadota bacterium]|nr:type II toxin-antitoxin system VapC family toxin [Armatimonadota bacterium]